MATAIQTVGGKSYDGFLLAIVGLLDRFLRRAAQARDETRVEFLGEQDGGPESKFKAAVLPVLSRNETVKRAYLARVGFQPHAAKSVALCLAGSLEIPPVLLRELANTFAQQFNSASALDILGVSPEQEADLRRVCAPFYKRAG